MSHSSRLEPAQPVDPAVLRDCRKRAMDLLARREHGCAELERKLVHKGFDEVAAADVVATLAAEGLVSDRRFAEAFVAIRVGRGQGPIRIEAELKERGIDPAVVADAIAGAECDWVSLAAAVRSKRFGPAAPADLKSRGQQSRFLNYRGFSGEQVKRALELAGD